MERLLDNTAYDECDDTGADRSDGGPFDDDFECLSDFADSSEDGHGELLLVAVLWW